MFGGDVGDHFEEEVGVEADFHGFAGIFAGHFFACVIGEFEVFGRYDEFLFGEDESYLGGGLVGEEFDAAKCVGEGDAVEGEFVWVVFRDGGFEVWVFAVDESAGDEEVVEGEEYVGAVVFHGDVGVFVTAVEDFLDE